MTEVFREVLPAKQHAPDLGGEGSVVKTSDVLVPELSNVFDLSKLQLIQGGMGVSVSNWRLARAVAIAGENLNQKVMGVVSATGLPDIFLEKLQEGDPETISALEDFSPEIKKRLFEKYLPNEKKLPKRTKRVPPRPEVLVIGEEATINKFNDIAVAAAYVEVKRAKEGHNGPIGINLLEEVPLTHLSVLLGAMMAGVDAVLVGAGIPYQIPQILDDFANNKVASYNLKVSGSENRYKLELNPGKFVKEGEKLNKPKFLPIVSSHALAMRLNETVEVDGFIIEGPPAGGHNAPARGKEVDELGQPIYGDRDQPKLDKIIELGKPFWLAGGKAGDLDKALATGAAGIQVGSAFAASNESGLLEARKAYIRGQISKGQLRVITSKTASPTGYPFQVVEDNESLSNPIVYEERERECTFGYLREAYRKDDGSTGFRCPAEPVADYIKNGGKEEETIGRKCLCTGLAEAAGHGREVRKGKPLQPWILTFGKEASEFISELINESPDPEGRYSAQAVVAKVFLKAARSLEQGVSVDVNSAPDGAAEEIL